MVVGVSGSEWMGVGESGWEWEGARFSTTRREVVIKKTKTLEHRA